MLLRYSRNHRGLVRRCHYNRAYNAVWSMIITERTDDNLRSGSGAASVGFCPTTASVFPNTTPPHLNSRFIPRSQMTSTEFVSSTTRTKVTSKTPALTLSLIRLMGGSASKLSRILSCFAAFLASAITYGVDRLVNGSVAHRRALRTGLCCGHSNSTSTFLMTFRTWCALAPA